VANAAATYATRQRCVEDLAEGVPQAQFLQAADHAAGVGAAHAAALDHQGRPQAVRAPARSAARVAPAYQDVEHVGVAGQERDSHG
jgi:hypothetical protein